MRRFLSILLTIILVFSLVACSNETNDNDNDTINTKPNNNQNDNIDKPNNDIEDINWELKDLTITVPEVKVETYTVDGVDETFEVGVTVYDFTGNDIIDIFKKNEFVSNNYVIDDVPSWEEHGFLADYDSKNGKVYNTHYVIGESVGADNEDASIFAHIGRNSYEFKNSDGFYLSFDGLDINKQTQNNTLSVLADVLGEDMANYLVYARDPDGKRNDKDLDNKFHLYEEIKSGIFVYVLERKVSNNDGYNNDITYSVDIHVDNYQMNWLMASSHNYEPKYESDFKYKIETIFPSLGQVNPSNHTDLFKNYYLIGSEDAYQYSAVDNISMNYYYSPYDGVIYETYSYAIESEKIDKGSYFQNEDMTARYTCEDVNGKLLDLRIDIEGDIELDDELSDDEVLSKAKDLIKKKLAHILPNLKADLSTIKVGEKTEIVGKYQHELVGGEWEYTLTVDLTCKYDDEICFDFEWHSLNALEQS